MPALGTTIIKYNPDGTAKVTRQSPLTNGPVTRTLPLTLDQYSRWERGELIQIALPHLTPDEREFLLTGMSEEEWKTNFSDDEEGLTS